MYEFPSVDVFKGQFGEKVDFAPAPDLCSMAERLIGEHWGLFGHLQRLNVQYLWKRDGGSKASKLRLGQCQRPTGLLGFYAKSDFIIWLAWNHGLALKLEPQQVEATLFHEMKHAGLSPTDDETPEIRPHDVEMFADEVRVYGLWRQDLECLKQLGLFEQKFVDIESGEIVIPRANPGSGEPHLHRRQDDKYPTMVCRDPECTLQPRYAVAEEVGA